MRELVSIITPSYNSEKYIAQTIESVLNQTYTEWEMIIVDDRSTDNSDALIERYAQKEERIKYIVLEENSGPAVARNRAIKEAQGRYIAFLDADDLWAPQKLEKQIAFMQKENIALSYTGYYRFETSIEQIIDEITVPLKVDYHELLKQNIIGCLTAVYDTKILGKVYMPLIRKRQDFGLWLKILKEVPYAYGMNEPLAYYRIHDDSISSNKIISSQYNWKLYREVEKLPWHKAVYYFAWYTYRSLLKYKS
ncbi:glycosyltransferase family 2 protein [Sulfurovum sp. zt1-1]|uniref:Glycosyltransferase family 2 protein n=1 Tax=Sulfurovum zhangzhouensis TaxID=3019067 RepID=A0ABT7QZY1_9BACT|nr:glycosyltransferase family 2 protein [Sulfurovum zhangzhouensis]MDM5272399.1 glycosyltransferase family 2 protein [Sulfurovum zhangzhouensis]